MDAPARPASAPATKPRPDGADSAVRLFAASTRNLLPRAISYVCSGAVACFFVGPAWSGAWFVASWAVVITGIVLMHRIAAQPKAPRAAVLTHILTLNNVVSAGLSAALAAALWASGDPMAQGFAFLMLFVGATYVLLQYYANPQTLLTLASPYAVALAYIGVEFARGRGLQSVVIVTLLAAATMMVNFFVFSRAMLDASRSALKKASERARRGEAAAGAANTAKSAFLATMSHEIRTPLNGVLGMAQAMAADRLPKVQRERLAIIHQSGESLLAILNDILDLSKMEVGKLDLEEIDFDLGQVAQGAHAAFTAIANGKGLSFALDIDKAQGVYRGDPTRLRQILYNLISNALKFTQEGEIRVTAIYADGALRIAVADTGIGIPAAALAGLFDEFSQVDATTTRRFGGTGLGLAICQKLASLMGGHIEVRSEDGLGSTFTLVAPLARLGEALASAPLPAPEASRAGIGGALKVLAAEDNSVNRLVLKTLLHQIGIEPVVVGDGAAAVEAWDAEEWDAILMDVQMPTMDGLAATRLIRSREAACGRRRTPIIALTANAMSHQVTEYRAAGIDGFVAKPIEASRLFEALQAAIDAPEEASLAAAS